MAVCQFEDSNKMKCGAELRVNLTTMAYHLTKVHGLEKFAPSDHETTSSTEARPCASNGFWSFVFHAPPQCNAGTVNKLIG